MTPRERRFDALQQLGCIVCLIECKGYQPCDIHHLVDKGDRAKSGGDMATIGLCLWHHRGQTPEGIRASQMKAMLGPSLRLHSREFNAKWPQRMLLEYVNEQLKVRA